MPMPVEKVEKKREEVKEYIESRGGKIVVPYISARDNIIVDGACGHRFAMKFNDIKRRGKDIILCQRCNSRDSQKPMTDQQLIDRAESIGFSNIEINGDKVNLTCSCGHDAEMSLSGLKKRIRKKKSKCRRCLTNEARDFSDTNIKTLERKHNIKISDKRKTGNGNWEVSIEYECGHTGTETIGSLQRKSKKYGELICTKCSTKEHAPVISESSHERKISFLLKELGVKYVSKYRKDYPNGLELDIYVKDKNLGIEADGIYWHSELKGKGRSYHLEKKKYFANLGINVLFFYDSEIDKKYRIVSSMIMNRLGMHDFRFYARDCEIRKIDSKTAKEFFDKTHIQGGNGSTNMSYGLYIGRNLVSAITFRWISKNSTLELYRFSNALNTSVPGAFSRLLKHSTKGLVGIELVTYADLRFSSYNPNETVYMKNGFEFDGYSRPNYKYFKTSDTTKLYSRLDFQKHKLKDKLEKFDPNKSETENMVENGFSRIFDCGNLVFKKHL